MGDISPMVALALSKCIKEKDSKAASKGLEAGALVTVDATVRISGTITKGEDYDVTDSTSLPWSKVLALAIHRSGFHKDFLKELATDILNDNLTDAEKAVVTQGETRWETEVKPLLPKRTNSGIVKANVTVALAEETKAE